eukprot:EG_transcript_6437
MSIHQHRRCFSLLCFTVSAGGIFFECCGAALKERLSELQGQLSALQHADRPLWEVALEELREPLDAEVDFPVVAALGVALFLRQKLRLELWAAVLSFAVSFVLLNAVLPSYSPAIASQVLWALLFFNLRTALPVFLVLHGYKHAVACGSLKDFLLQAFPAHEALEPSLRSPLLIAVAPYLTLGSHVFRGCLAHTGYLKYAVLCAMGLHQLLDWGAVVRWCRCGAWGLGVGVPLAAAASLCLWPDARVHDVVLFVLVAFAVRRVLPLPAAWWLQLAVDLAALRAFRGPAGLFPHLEHTPLQALFLTLLHQMSLELLQPIARLGQWQTAHRDAGKAEVEQRSQSVVYAFSAPRQAGRMWRFPVGTHRWGLWRSWLGLQCRSLSIPNGMEVKLQLSNGVLRSFTAKDNVDALPPLPVTGLVVQDGKSLERCRSPPSWALAEPDDSEDEALLTVQTPHISPASYRIRGQLRTDREVAQLQRSPEYVRHRNRLRVQALRLDLPMALLAVAQVWFVDDTPDVRNAVSLLCLTAWLGQALLR